MRWTRGTEVRGNSGERRKAAVRGYGEVPRKEAAALELSGLWDSEVQDKM